MNSAQDLPAANRFSRGELAFLLLLPILSFFGLNFIRLLDGYDPFIYTGYMNNPADLLQRYGLLYYSVRFGLILPGRLFSLLFGPEAGFFALRYVLALLCGVPLYAVVKRYCSMPVAALTYTALLTSPWLVRALMWDHPDSTGTCFLSAAICLTLLDRSPAWGRDFLAGACASMAFNSNAFTGFVLAIFGVTYAVLALLYGQGRAALLKRAAGTLAGFVLIFAGGWLYYWYVFGKFVNILEPTLYIARLLGDGGSKTWHLNGTEWVWTRFHVFIPVLIVLLCIVTVVRKRMTFEAAVIALSGTWLVAFYWYRQFGRDENYLQLIFYVSYAIPLCYLMMAYSWQALASHTSMSTRTLAWIAGAAAVVPWVLTTWGIPSLERVELRSWFALAILTLTTALVAVTTTLGRRFALACAAAALLPLTVDAGLAGGRLGGGAGNNRPYGVVYSFFDEPRSEMSEYRIAQQFIRAVPKLKDRPGKIVFWYTGDGNNFLNVIQSTYLWGYSKLNQTLPDDPGIPHLGEPQMRMLADPEVRLIGILGQSTQQVQDGLAALTRAQVGFRVDESRLLADGNLRVYWQLLEITSHPPAPPASASK